MAMRHPYSSRPLRVRGDEQGRPVAVAGMGVTQIREEWLVEDGWWSGEPIRRRYFEVVLEDGRNIVVFRDDASSGAPRWYRQRA